MGKFQALDQPGERIGLDMTLIRPLSGNLALVHAIGGKEVARWKLDIPAGDGIAVWCDIGVSKSASHCGAVISNHPHPLGGYYYLLTNGNKVLEAGLSFYLCD
jgi:hypothetical protein